MALQLLHKPNFRHLAAVFFDDPDLDTPQEEYEKQKEKAGLYWDEEKRKWAFKESGKTIKKTETKKKTNKTETKTEKKKEEEQEKKTEVKRSILKRYSGSMRKISRIMTLKLPQSSTKKEILSSPRKEKKFSIIQCGRT